jgi:RNA recognition motif-containing protein
VRFWRVVYSALAQDAATAIEKLQGSQFHGRKLMLELGHKKERTGRNKTAEKEATGDAEAAEPEVGGEVEKEGEEGDASAASKPTHKQQQQQQLTKTPKTPKTPKAVLTAEEAQAERETVEMGIKKSRQVLIFGVSMDVNKKHFKALGVKASRKTEVELLKEVRRRRSTIFLVNYLLALRV